MSNFEQQTKDLSKKNFFDSWLSIIANTGLLVSGITFFAYFLAYCSIFALLDYYNIPLIYSDINISDIGSTFIYAITLVFIIITIYYCFRHCISNILSFFIKITKIIFSKKLTTIAFTFLYYLIVKYLACQSMYPTYYEIVCMTVYLLTYITTIIHYSLTDYVKWEFTYYSIFSMFIVFMTDYEGWSFSILILHMLISLSILTFIFINRKNNTFQTKRVLYSTIFLMISFVIQTGFLTIPIFRNIIKFDSTYEVFQYSALNNNEKDYIDMVIITQYKGSYLTMSYETINNVIVIDNNSYFIIPLGIQNIRHLNISSTIKAK